MRYYAITIVDPASGKTLVPDPKTRVFTLQPSGPNVATYTSHVNGQFIPGALNIELDATVYPMAMPQGGTMLRVWGVSLTEIGQRASLNGKLITIAAGMQKGLPLANPAQAGVIVKAKILQAFGNWQGTEQSLDFVIWPDIGTHDEPKSLTLNWKSGTQLAPALTTALNSAFPGVPLTMSISPNLVANGDQVGPYPTLIELSQMLNGLTSKMNISKGYAGVSITYDATGIHVFDGTVTPKPTQIAFQDMVGQPTWIDAVTINLPLVMRYDLAVGGVVTLPQGILGTPYTLTTAPAALPNVPATATAKNSTSFTGNFTITEVHHFGNYRQPDANSWVTVINAIAQTTG